jgi:hypothetical protein
MAPRRAFFKATTTRSAMMPMVIQSCRPVSIAGQSLSLRKQLDAVGVVPKRRFKNGAYTGGRKRFVVRKEKQCLEDRLAEASCFALGMALVPSQDDSTASWRGTNEGR